MIEEFILYFFTKKEKKKIKNMKKFMKSDKIYNKTLLHSFGYFQFNIVYQLSIKYSKL